ncbi:hypothetical protein ACQEVB_37830 [Pseudonocardia sp. CA-107938]|uniref:hypothetical protein n=1 Tax=Pseudonocardia sp. CA-107938 TaxID=3240021 RepID=UPI003D8F8A9E
MTFDDLVEEFVGRPGVTPPAAHGTGFGSHALKVDGRIFAMHVRDHLVVKLPRARVVELVADGVGSPFDANTGTPKKEWLTVLDESAWPILAAEAYAFVGKARAV